MNILVKNHLRIAVRNLLRQKFYTFINISGLAVGIACCLLILLYIQHELSYDRHYSNANQIYRVAIERHFPNREIMSAATPRALAATLANDFPEVIAATRLTKERADDVLVGHENKRFFEDRFFFADSNFFDVFAIPLLQGNPKTVLRQPHSVVITEAMACKYFGEESPIGKRITIRVQGDNDFFNYQVTGVARNIPVNSHFHFDFLASYRYHPFFTDGRSQSWGGFRLYTYITLAKTACSETLDAKFPQMIRSYFGPQIEENVGISFDEYLAAGNRIRFFLQPLTDIHLHSHLSNEIEHNGNIAYVYLFAAIALFILLLACINFMNLATARSANRGREVGVRRVLGSHRTQLIQQFLTESTLLSLLALILALGLVEFLLPAFNALAGKQLETNYFSPWFVIPGLLGLALLVGILAGTYPAFFLSAFRPVIVLKGAPPSSTIGRSAFRNGLVVFQFAVSVMLMIATLVIYHQIDYMRDKKLGFEKEHLVVIEGTEVVWRQIEVFKQELLRCPGVISAGNSQAIPGETFWGTLISAEGAAEGEAVSTSWITASFGFVETLDLELRAGRSLSPEFATDSLAVILNETAVKELGLPEPIGKKIIYEDRPYMVVGIVKDFHFASLHHEIGPLAIFGPDPWNHARPNQIVAVRIKPNDIPSTVAFLEKTWNGFVPHQPFRYSFVDKNFDTLYQAEQTTVQLFGVFSALTISIACLGIFGLAAFTAEQRTKEIGIRKVLGASPAGIVLLLSKEFIKLIAIAFVLASPLAYYAMNRWLQDFAYRIDISFWIYLLAAILTFFITLFTVCFQTIKAAHTNPVESLRYE